MFESIADIARMYRTGECSPVEYVTDLMASAESANEALGAFIAFDPGAIEAAKQAEATLRAGGQADNPLLGVPYGIKDIIDAEGMATTAHSAMLRDNYPGRDATVIARLRQRGAVSMGKLSCHEFANGGPTFDLPWAPARNPHNLKMYPGGSSSGSGAAVAAGLTPFALGTDTGGSIRGPAFLCGIVGLKVTDGRVSVNGVLPLAPSLDSVGPMARTVEDCAIVLEAIAGRDALDPASSNEDVPAYASLLTGDISGLRVGYVRDFHTRDVPDANPELVAHLDAAVQVLQDLGANVRDVSMPSLATTRAVFKTLMLGEAAAYHGDALRNHPELYAPITRRKLLPGLFMSAEDYVLASQARQRLKVEFDALMADFDVLVCASGMDPACEIDDEERLRVNYDRQCRSLFNVMGVPALGVPIGFTSDGLPLGMQLVGGRFREADILRAGHAYEQATDWMSRHPVVPVS